MYRILTPRGVAWFVLGIFVLSAGAIALAPAAAAASGEVPGGAKKFSDHGGKSAKAIHADVVAKHNARADAFDRALDGRYHGEKVTAKSLAHDTSKAGRSLEDRHRDIFDKKFDRHDRDSIFDKKFDRHHRDSIFDRHHDVFDNHRHGFTTHHRTSFGHGFHSHGFGSSIFGFGGHRHNHVDRDTVLALLALGVGGRGYSSFHSPYSLYDYGLYGGGFGRGIGSVDCTPELVEAAIMLEKAVGGRVSCAEALEAIVRLRVAAEADPDLKALLTG